MKPGRWSWLVLSVPFSALTLSEYRNIALSCGYKFLTNRRSMSQSFFPLAKKHINGHFSYKMHIFVTFAYLLAQFVLFMFNYF